MLKIYNINSLVHWTEREIDAREYMTGFFAKEVRNFLKSENQMWEMERIEAPVMLPRSLVNPQYTDDDLWVFRRHLDTEEELVAKPETTPSTYAYMEHQLVHRQGLKLPWCVWQASKSFRAERDQVLSHMRLKEFYQQEFQCAYTVDTMNDYQEKCLEPVRKMIATAVHLPTRIIASDRLPSYSLRTMDIEVLIDERWMEVCSISKRTDFPVKFRYMDKKKEVQEKDVLVLEIAIGLDRMVHAWNQQ